MVEKLTSKTSSIKVFTERQDHDFGHIVRFFRVENDFAVFVQGLIVSLLVDTFESEFLDQSARIVACSFDENMRVSIGRCFVQGLFYKLLCDFPASELGFDTGDGCFKCFLYLKIKMILRAAAPGGNSCIYNFTCCGRLKHSD